MFGGTAPRERVRDEARGAAPSRGRPSGGPPGLAEHLGGGVAPAFAGGLGRFVRGGNGASLFGKIAFGTGAPGAGAGAGAAPVWGGGGFGALRGGVGGFGAFDGGRRRELLKGRL